MFVRLNPPDRSRPYLGVVHVRLNHLFDVDFICPLIRLKLDCTGHLVIVDKGLVRILQD
jgi:hypothetical protein